MTDTYQMLEWIEECEQAARDHDLLRLGKLLSGINGILDTEFAHTRKSLATEFKSSKSAHP